MIETRVARAVEILGQPVPRQRDEADTAVPGIGPDPPRHLEPVHAGEPDVQDHDVGLELLHEAEGRRAAVRHPALEVRLLQEHAEQLLADTTRYAGGRMLARVVDTSASATTADELEAFVAARLSADALVDARRAGDEIRTRARLKARLLPQLEAALATH